MSELVNENHDIATHAPGTSNSASIGCSDHGLKDRPSQAADQAPPRVAVDHNGTEARTHSIHPPLTPKSYAAGSDDADCSTAEILKALGPDTAVVTLKANDPRLRNALNESGNFRPIHADIISAVVCGRESQGLCVLTLPDRETVDLFFRDNPGLANTLVTTEDRLHCVWLRLTDAYPENVKSSGMQLVTSATLMVTTMALSGPSSMTVTMTKFADVNWPKALDNEFFLARTLAEFGPYYLKSGQKRTVLNQAVFARLIVRWTGLSYDADAQAFYSQKLSIESDDSVPTSAVMDQVTRTLSKVAADCPVDFPAHEMRASRIRSLIDHIKLVATCARPTARDSLAQFIRDRVCLKPGTNLTVEELHASYVAFGRQKNISMLPRSTFHRELPLVMLQMFTVPRAHNLKRPVEGTKQMTSRRGFSGVALQTDTGDGRDVPDETDGAVPL